MQIEQRVPEQSIDAIMKDPRKYRKMMLIIQQTLYDLGYHDSAKMLEIESGVSFYTEELLQIKSHLQQNDYDSVIEVIQKLQKQSQNFQQPQTQNQPQPINQPPNHDSINNSPLSNRISEQLPNSTLLSTSEKFSRSSLAQTKSMIYETYCMEKILNQQFDDAMKIISQNILNESKRQALCEALVLGNHHVTKHDIQLQFFINQSKKQQIFKFCLSEYQDIGERQIQKVIESYTQLEGNHNRELKKLLSSSKKLPPIKLLTYECSQHIKNQISHMKINSITNQLLIVDESKDSQQILLLNIDEKNWQYQRNMSQSRRLSLKLSKKPIFSPLFNREVSFLYNGKRQSVESVAFNYNRENPLVAVASYSIIQIFNSKMDLTATVQAENKIQKFICIQFNPLSDLLYNCGYFEAMRILDSTGQQIASIYPYPKTRKFHFYKSEIIGISLVANKIYKHSVDEQVLICEKELDQAAIPMDFCLNQKQDKLAVSSLQFLYLLDTECLEIMAKAVSPLNPNKLMIETKFYGDFLITLAKNFTCYDFAIDKTIQSPKSYLINKIHSWSGEGTFDISNELFISGNEKINCWQQADADFIMDEHSDFEEEIDGGLARDMEEVEEDGEDQIEDSDSESSQDGDDDDSMDEEDEEISV